MERILVVDDEPGIRQVLCGVLGSAGYQVDAADSGEAALDRLAQSDYDLLLVDIQMPGVDGLGLIERARVNRPSLATVILTGFASVDSAVWALRENVDDYLVKPARPDAIRAAVRRALERRRAALAQSETLSRISAEIQTLLVHTPPAANPSPWRCGPLLIDEAAHHAEWFGQPLALTPVEFKLLLYLARNVGKVLSPQTLVSAVQGYESSPLEARELIKPHIYSLRAKLESDPTNPRYLVNVRGVGYMLRPG
ncbi:MAG: response regulator transcription factor [Anaerolineales bacterium]